MRRLGITFQGLRVSERVKAIIPARSGSKRVPGKNIRCLGGRPLIFWTIEAVIQSGIVNEIFLSTDDLRYFDLAREAFPNAPLSLDLRDEASAGDKVKIFDYVKAKVNRFSERPDDIMLLALPTVPFRSATSIKECFEKFKTSGRAVFSCCEYGFPTSFAFRIERDGHWNSIANDSPMVTGNTQSQQQLKTYHPNGAIYFRSFSDFKSENLTTFYDDANPYVMSPSESIDIDTENDFALAEKLCK